MTGAPSMFGSVYPTYQVYPPIAPIAAPAWAANVITVEQVENGFLVTHLGKKYVVPTLDSLMPLVSKLWKTDKSGQHRQTNAS